MTSTPTPKRKKYAIGPRAAVFARKIFYDFRRMVGVLDSGAKNRKWVVTICRWITAQPKLPNAKGKWKQDLKV